MIRRTCRCTTEAAAREANPSAECSAPALASVQELVTAQAAVTPNNAAVVVGDEVLTYGQLNARANQIAHSLRPYTAGPDRLVAVCIERSAPMVAAELAVLKSGAAYLPIDASYPPEHLAFTLEDARPSVLLTQHHLAGHLPKGKWRTIEVESGDLKSATNSKESTGSSVTGQNLAYVIYTSGSTGRPKGVQITHDSLLNLILWHQQAFSVQPTDRATQLASP